MTNIDIDSTAPGPSETPPVAVPVEAWALTSPGDFAFPAKTRLLLEKAHGSSTPALDPGMLGPLTREAIAALMREGDSPNTLRAYKTALTYWAGWFALRYRQTIELPVSVEVVLQFIVDHAQRTSNNGPATELPLELERALVDSGLKAKLGAVPALASLEMRLNVLSKIHRIKQAENPCQAVVVRELMTKIRRAYAKRGATAKPKPALTREPLEALLSTCDDTLIGVRDRALLLFAWGSGGRRRSEVTQARMEQLRRISPGVWVFELNYSKTNQNGERLASNDKPLVGKVALALETWLERSQIKEGPVFRRIRRGGALGSEALVPSAVRDIVKDRSQAAGLVPGFSAHSLRSGFVTEAARRSIPLAEAMAMTGHTSLKTFTRYFRADPQNLKGAHLLDDEEG
jgi:integrase